MATRTLLDDALELAELLKPAWAQISDSIPAWHPRNEGDPDPDPGKREPDPDPDPDPNPDPEPGNELDWKAEARKHERRAKQERKAREDLERRLKELEDKDKSDQEKAIEQARKEAREEVLSEAETERRNDRLEVAVARHAAKTFADVDDALLHIQRDIASGEIDPDDIFDDKGKVQTDALKAALDDLLERKPHLKADAGSGRPGGSSDAGRGGGTQMSREDAVKLARTDPVKFNEMLDKGEIPASALG